MHKAKSDH